MLEKLGELGKKIIKAGPGTVILLILVPVAFCVLTVAFVNNYLKKSYEIICLEDALKVSNVSNDFNTYLDEVEIFVDTCAEGVEYLVKQNADHDTIHDYLSIEFKNLTGRIYDDTDGIYGYINGEYNDGFGWIPEEGFDPTERDWYKDALAAGEQTVISDPYVDVRTENLVVTVSKALRNGIDVVALDLNLQEFQELVEGIASEINDHDLVILDENGVVIASSLPDEAGRDFSNDEDINRRTVFADWKNSEGKTFFSTLNGRRYLISQEPIRFGWTALSITDINTVTNTLGNIAILSLAVIALGACLLFALIIVIAKRRIKADDESESLYSISGIYTTIHKIDLSENSFKQILCHDYMVSEAIGSRNTDTGRVIKEVMKKVTEQRSLEEVLEFVDLSTLDRRMKGRDTISVEFLNYEHLWHRGRFIAVDRYQDGSLRVVLWAVEQIDDEKRYRDKLQYLAETDQLTGINNRGSGEHKIRGLIQNGIGGMFVLFDADKFKSINDTYGHEAGDHVLIAIAECMSRSFRDRDIIMRLGGDEFAVYVPYVYTRADGEPIIERFISAIQKINLPEIEGRPINISLGVAFYHKDDLFTFEDLYKEADACTYESKKVTGCYATYYSA